MLKIRLDVDLNPLWYALICTKWFGVLGMFQICGLYVFLLDSIEVKVDKERKQMTVDIMDISKSSK